MKKKYLLLLIILAFSCNQQTESPSFTINGTVDGIRSGKVFLKLSDVIDTAIIEKGKFVFNGTVSEPYIVQISIEGYSGYKEFYLENSDICFIAQKDSIEKSQITGCRLEDEKEKYKALTKLIELKLNIDSVNEKYETADETEEAELEKIYDKYYDELVEIQKQFIKDHPASYLSISICWDIDWSFKSAAEYREFIYILDTSLNKYQNLIDLNDYINRLENVEIGHIAPDFEMADSSGQMRRLSDFYSKSSYLLLDFWGATCGPCRKENPNVRKAYHKYHSAGFDVFGVSTDTNKEYWVKAIVKDGLIWTNVCSLKKWSKNEVVKTYALHQVFQNFVLDNHGKIIARDIHGDELMNKLDELLKNY